MSTNPQASVALPARRSFSARRNAVRCKRMRRCKIGGRALLILLSLVRVGPDHSLLEHEATVEAPFAGLDHAIGFLREFIEGKSLDRAHWQRAALRGVDLTLHLDLHRKDLIGLADDLHSQSGLVDKGIERQDGKDRACRTAGR